MPRWLKVTLIIVGSGLLLLGLCVAGGVWWFQSHRAELLANAKQSELEGQAYAEGKDTNACIREGILRLSSSSGITQEVTLRIFVRACLKSAKRDPLLCVGVPEESEILQTVAWRLRVCKEQGKEGDEPCARLLAAVQDVCHPK